MKLNVNGKTMVLPTATTLAGLLEQLGIPQNRSGIAIAINDEVIGRDEWPSLTLDDGDNIEIIHAVQGG